MLGMSKARFLKLLGALSFSLLPTVASANIVQCDSVNGNYAECIAERTGVSDVSLLQQTSGARCIKGVTFGVAADSRRIFVTRGCSGTFQTIPVMPGYPGYPNYPGYPGYPNQPGHPGHPGMQEVVRINCSSIDKKLLECRIGGRVRDVRLVKQYSSHSCTKGSTFGVNAWGDGIWVSRGCRGAFDVLVRR